MTRWLGRGLDDIAGKPFGWAWHQERDEIRAHILKRRTLLPLELERRIDDIQIRIHRNRPTLRQRQAARFIPSTSDRSLRLTDDELNYIIDIFGSANNPVAISIAAKARSVLP